MPLRVDREPPRAMLGAVSRSLIIVGLIGCKSVPAAPEAEIVDLSSSVEAMRLDFNAHRDEPRFVTLLSPS